MSSRLVQQEGSRPNEYRKAVRRLRSGVPSPSAARLISVGTDKVEEFLYQHEEAWRHGNPNTRLVFVHADWGFGKTHLQMLLVATFLRRRIPFVYDNVDGKTGSLAHLHRTVPRWMESVQSGTHRGIRSIMEELADRQGLDTWCKHRKSTFSKHLIRALDGHDWEWNLVAGHQYQFPDYSYNDAKGLEILEDFASVLSGLRMGGIVLMLDEAENVSREHDIRGRRKAYETLQKLSQSRNLFIILFTTERFFQQIDDDKRRGIAAAWDSWPPDAMQFVTGIERVPIARPPQITSSLANAIVDRIVDVYSQAFNCYVAQHIKERVLGLWKQTATKSARLLVRITIDTLDRCRD